jgi:hypothetical protein
LRTALCRRRLVFSDQSFIWLQVLLVQSDWVRRQDQGGNFPHLKKIPVRLEGKCLLFFSRSCTTVYRGVSVHAEAALAAGGF